MLVFSLFFAVIHRYFSSASASLKLYTSVALFWLALCIRRLILYLTSHDTAVQVFLGLSFLFIKSPSYTGISYSLLHVTHSNIVCYGSTKIVTWPCRIFCPYNAVQIPVMKQPCYWIPEYDENLTGHWFSSLFFWFIY